MQIKPPSLHKFFDYPAPQSDGGNRLGRVVPVARKGQVHVLTKAWRGGSDRERRRYGRASILHQAGPGKEHGEERVRTYHIALSSMQPYRETLSRKI